MLETDTMKWMLALPVILTGTALLLYQRTRPAYLLALVIVLSFLLLLPFDLDIHDVAPWIQLRNPQRIVSPVWDLRYHLGGNSPWIPKVDGVVDGGIEVPLGCSVDQAVMFSRHAERYPTMKAGTSMTLSYSSLEVL